MRKAIRMAKPMVAPKDQPIPAMKDEEKFFRFCLLIIIVYKIFVSPTGLEPVTSTMSM